MRFNRRSDRILVLSSTLATLALSTAAAASTPDGLGTVDAVFAVVQSQNRVCEGDGTGAFACSDVDGNAHFTNDVALGFVDGDGFLDAVFANSSSQSDQVCLGDGTGAFSCSDVSAETSPSGGVALGFVDGDANLDAVFAIAAFPNGLSRVCLGNGLGGFSCADTLPGDFIRTVALGFLDGDTNLDLILGSSNPDPSTPSRVCLGDGSGGFSCSDLTGFADSTYEVELGFVDGDAHLDAVFANNFPRPRVCLGDGLGGFPSCAEIDSLDNFYRGVALGFLDADGNLDAVFARSGASGNRNRVCLGDGTGGFSCSDVSADTNKSEDVALGFVDADANLDAVFANSGQADRVCFGDGSGGFSSCADADADGTADSVQGDGGPGFTAAVALGEIIDRDIFKDGFESGSTDAWSTSVE